MACVSMVSLFVVCVRQCLVPLLCVSCFAVDFEPS